MGRTGRGRRERPARPSCGRCDRSSRLLRHLRHPTAESTEVTLRQHVREAIKPVAAALDRIRPPARGVTVLIYHRVGGGSTGQVDLDPALFDEQMAALAESGRAVTLDRALEVLAAPEAPPGADPVVVTFDDGTPDVVETALPILARHRIPALLYVATDFLESGRPFWSPDDRPLTWSALADATVGDTDTGQALAIGSHTHTHALLDRLGDAAAVADELDRSIELIRDRLGIDPRHFAYPKALPPGPVADAAVRARFASAALAGTRPNPYGATDPYRLARSPIQRGDGMRWFTAKLDGGLGLEDRLRDLVNKRRYAGATS